MSDLTECQLEEVRKALDGISSAVTIISLATVEKTLFEDEDLPKWVNDTQIGNLSNGIEVMTSYAFSKIEWLAEHKESSLSKTAKRGGSK